MSGDLNKETLLRYIELDNKIQELERQKVHQKYEQLASQLKNTLQEKEKVDAAVLESSKVLEKEKGDVVNVNKTIEAEVAKRLEQIKIQQTGMGKGTKEEEEKLRNELKKTHNFEKEQAEHMEALTKHETNTKMLESVKQRITELEKALEPAKKEKEPLDELLNEQAAVLNSIFNGEYGSAEENRLEAHLDVVQTRKQKIDLAHYKWTNSRVLLQHAVNQLSFATQCFDQLPDMHKSPQLCYQKTTEVRNNVLAAIQNIERTQSYLSNIQFPYCKPEEMVTLHKAVNNIYTDIQTVERKKHAAACYSTTCKRLQALKQWFDDVINNTIVKDSKIVNAEVVETEKHLRAERMRLLKEMADKANIAFDVDEKGKKDEQSIEQEPDVKPDGDVQKEVSGPVIKVKDLPPPPSQEEMFGDMKEVMKRRDQADENQRKIDELNKSRMNQGLDEKLALRRQRRNLKN